MKKQKSNQSNKLNLKNTKQGVIPLLGVSLIIFLLTVAVYFVANYVADSYAKDNQLSNWSYQYTDKAGVTPEGELRIYNAQNPILTESGVKKDYIYMTKLLEASDNKQTIILITDYAPMKISVNGREIYDNQFDDAEYVGNCYNAFTLEPSTHERQIEVYMKLPLSVRFEAYLNIGGDPAFTPGSALYLGIVLAGIGLLAILVFAFLSLKRRRFFHSLLTGVIVLYVGAAVVLHRLPEITYLLNDAIWLRLTELPVHLTFLLMTWFVSRRFKNNKRTKIIILVAAVLATAFSLTAFTPFLVKLSSVMICVLSLAAIVFAAQAAMNQMEHRTQYATAIFVILAFYALIALFAGILLALRLRVLYMYNVAISTFVVGGLMEYIYIADYRFEQKNRDLRQQSEGYEKTIDKVAEFMNEMLHCKKDNFYVTAADKICELVKYYDPESDPHCSIAEKKDGVFHEVYNRGVTGCEYKIIERNCENSGKNCIFAQTYFEFLLTKEKIVSVFHFENLSDGLDAFFNCIMEATYCGLETTYENNISLEDQRDVNIIFEELAENTELDNGCSVDHLQNIHDHSRALAIRLGMDEQKAEHIALASKLHDLGKIAVPKYIIEKQGRLSEDERLIVNSHTEFGYTLLSAYESDPLLKTASVIARYHHERYDGTGTNGLKGEDIPIEARIVTVCDVYDALVSERTYKSAWKREDAIHYLKENEEKIFDPVICEQFLLCLEEEAQSA